MSEQELREAVARWLHRRDHGGREWDNDMYSGETLRTTVPEYLSEADALLALAAAARALDERELREALIQNITMGIISQPNGLGLSWDAAQALASDIANRTLAAARDAHVEPLDVETLAQVLPGAINFRFLPSRIRTDPIWHAIASDIFARLRAEATPDE